MTFACGEHLFYALNATAYFFFSILFSSLLPIDEIKVSTKKTPLFSLYSASGTEYIQNKIYHRRKKRKNVFVFIWFSFFERQISSLASLERRRQSFVSIATCELISERILAHMIDQIETQRRREDLAEWMKWAKCTLERERRANDTHGKCERSAIESNQAINVLKRNECEADNAEHPFLVGVAFESKRRTNIRIHSHTYNCVSYQRPKWNFIFVKANRIILWRVLFLSSNVFDFFQATNPPKQFINFDENERRIKEKNWLDFMTHMFGKWCERNDTSNRNGKRMKRSSEELSWMCFRLSLSCRIRSQTNDWKRFIHFDFSNRSSIIIFLFNSLLVSWKFVWKWWAILFEMILASHKSHLY